jgi:peptidoglycan hydrolase-like protein with peptidoglycan-binding domain
MRNKIYILFLGAIVFISATATSLAATSLWRDLKLGDSGEDVTLLQKFLNTDTRTRVAQNGNGSPGLETSYFGPATMVAVKAFQGIYIGMQTGYVGALTRTAIEKIQNEKVIPIHTVATATTSVSSTVVSNYTPPTLGKTSIIAGVVAAADIFKPVDQNDFLLTGISHFEVRPGDTIALFGFGFEKDNVVFFGNEKVSSTLVSPTEIRVVVPKLAKQTYDIYVVNKRGSTKARSIFSVKIGSSRNEKPYITESSPTSASIDSTITIKGNGFDKNNTIYSALGILQEVPSKNGVITFSIKDFPEIKKFNGVREELATMPVYISVGTSKGITSNFAYVILNGK